MCKAFDKTRGVVEEFSRRESFGKDELYNTILKRGGVLRIKAGYSVKDFLEDLEYKGSFQYHPKTKKYTRINN